jgi:iron complex outermembrane receptor protein
MNACPNLFNKVRAFLITLKRTKLNDADPYLACSVCSGALKGRYRSFKRKSIFLSLLIPLFFFTPLWVKAQSSPKLYGYVFDAETGAVLSGANITIKNKVLGAVSDINGYFEVHHLLNGAYTVTAAFMGYQKSTKYDVYMDGKQSVQLIFNLLPQSLKAASIEVIGETYHRKTASGYTIFLSDIEAANGRNLSDVLQKVPGIEILSNGGAGSEQKISIRGGNHNQTLVLLDGVPLNDPLSGSADLSQIPLNMIEKIEIYEGGNSSKFGSGALGGAINIITKKKQNNELNISYMGGDFNLNNLETSIASHFSDIHMLLSMSYQDEAGNFPYEYNNTSGEKTNTKRVNSGSTHYHFFLKMKYQMEKLNIALTAQKNNNRRGTPGKVGALTAYAKSDREVNAIGLSLRYHQLYAHINFSETTAKNSNLFPRYPQQKYTKNPQYLYQYHTLLFHNKINFNYEISPLFQFDGGFIMKYQIFEDKNLLSTEQRPLTSDELSHSFYFQPQIEFKLAGILNRILITPSFRYDHFLISAAELERREEQFSPAVTQYVSFGKGEKFYVSGIISKAFRIPTFTDLFYQDVRIKGKPDLSAEKGFNREIGVGFRYYNAAGLFHLSGKYYLNTIKDMIIWRLASFEVFKPFNNDAELSGYQCSMEYIPPFLKTSLYIDYLYMKALDKSDQHTLYGKYLPYRAKHTVKANFNTELNGFRASVAYQHTGKRFVTTANTVELKPYHKADITISKSMQWKKIKTLLSVSALNFTNSSYQLVRGYPMPGVNYRIKISITY